jgi:tetratricopeptide (TPR) repeat protein
LIAATFERVLAEAGPRQAAVLRRCAVPHWFDAGVLALLRERPDGNERVLEQLAAYSFVRPVGPGRYAYQEDVRAALLAAWRAEQPAELADLHRQLFAHFAARTAATPATDVKLPNVTISMRPAGDWDLWAREALYHQLHADPAAGLDALRAAFDAAERDHRLGDADALLLTAADAPLDAAGAQWLRYLRARLARASLRLDDAAGQLETLLSEELAPPLAAAARQTLGETLAETGQWVRATELYRESLAFYQGTGARARAAEVMLRLGDAYRGVGLTTGGWYVPAFAQNPLLRGLGEAWYWLLGLPFRLVAIVLRRTPWALPRPQHLASYQNWLIARIYRTAQDWYEQARAAYAALGDERGVLAAEQQQAEILILFGYAADALAGLEALRARPAAQDIYRRLWLETASAAALTDLGDVAGAQRLLAGALAGFRQVGDARGEAAALALQGRAVAASGTPAEALELYRSSLASFRKLRYVAAREQALYALRAWQRTSGPGALSDQINAVLDAEPEKRYVARFPRSLLPQIQALVVGSVPLTLLLAALVAPSTVVRRIGGSLLLEQATFFNLWNVLALLVVMSLLGLGIYALVGLMLMFFIRLEALEREQPDYLITSERGIARYDYRGALALEMSWGDIRRWMKVDRRLWQRPLALFSLTLLEAADGSDLRIDGITGWYNGLQRDIGLHLRGAGNSTRAEERGVRLLPSLGGASLGLGLGLLLLCIWADNRWSEALLQVLPSELYAFVYVLAFSGLLILLPLNYWFVTHPLAIHRQLALRERWPWVVGAAGLAAVLLFAVGGGRALPVAALNIGLLLWGAYALAEAVYTVCFPRRPALGVALVLGAVLLASIASVQPIAQLYYATLSKTYTRQADYGAAEQAGSASLPEDSSDPAPGEHDPGTAASWQQIGDALYLQGNFAGAVEAYTRALRLLPQANLSAAEREQAAVILLNRARAQQKIASPGSAPAPAPGAQNDEAAACRLAPQLCDR